MQSLSLLIKSQLLAFNSKQARNVEDKKEKGSLRRRHSKRTKNSATSLQSELQWEKIYCWSELLLHTWLERISLFLHSRYSWRCTLLADDMDNNIKESQKKRKKKEKSISKKTLTVSPSRNFSWRDDYFLSLTIFLILYFYFIDGFLDFIAYLFIYYLFICLLVALFILKKNLFIWDVIFWDVQEQEFCFKFNKFIYWFEI
jgi:hypothetical protein